MRRLFFSLLILLTAFRGLVGDAMAYEMTKQMTHGKMQGATQSVAHHADSTPSNGHISSKKPVPMPCHEIAGEDAVQEPSLACTTCQVCHLSASLPQPAVGIATLAPASDLQIPSSIAWRSADQQRLIKPPIL
jgi:hypothetical protein